MTPDESVLLTKRAKPVLLTGAFWADTFERVVTAVAAVALSLLGTNVVDPSTIDWSKVGWTLLFTAVFRLLLCIAAKNIGDSPVPNASFFLASGKKVT